MFGHTDRAGRRWAQRSSRVFNRVEIAADVRPMDVLSYLARDQSWREGTVDSRAHDVGPPIAWWVIADDWVDNEVRRRCVLVQRLASGCLAEVVDHGHAPPVIFLS